MGSGEFLNINFFTALFTLANTVALFLVLKKYLFKPVLKMIETRQKEIDDLYADAGNAKKNIPMVDGTRSFLVRTLNHSLAGRFSKA